MSGKFNSCHGEYLILQWNSPALCVTMTENKECSSTNFEIWSLIQCMVFLYIPISYLHPALTLLSCHALVQCCFLQKLRQWSQERRREDDKYFRPSTRTSWHKDSLVSITILPLFLLPCISRSLFPSALRMTVFLSFSQLDWNKHRNSSKIWEEPKGWPTAKVIYGSQRQA